MGPQSEGRSKVDQKNTLKAASVQTMVALLKNLFLSTKLAVETFFMVLLLMVQKCLPELPGISKTLVK